LKTTGGSIAILNRTKSGISESEDFKNQLMHFIESLQEASILPEKDITATLLNQYNLMLISFITWNNVSEHYKEALQLMPSTLIISK